MALNPASTARRGVTVPNADFMRVKINEQCVLQRRTQRGTELASARANPGQRKPLRARTMYIIERDTGKRETEQHCSY